MEISRRTWTAAVKLAIVLSLFAAAIAVGVVQMANVSQTAVVLPVIVVAFLASWIQTERIQRRAMAEMVIIPARVVTSKAA